MDQLDWNIVTLDPLTELAQAFLDRAAGAGWDDGKKTKAAVEYFTGAYVALRALAGNRTDSEAARLAKRIETSVQMMLFASGYREVERLALKPDNE